MPDTEAVDGTVEGEWAVIRSSRRSVLPPARLAGQFVDEHTHGESVRGMVGYAIGVSPEATCGKAAVLRAQHRVEAEWLVVEGELELIAFTRRIHNGLRGSPNSVAGRRRRLAHQSSAGKPRTRSVQPRMS